MVTMDKKSMKNQFKIIQKLLFIIGFSRDPPHAHVEGGGYSNFLERFMFFGMRKYVALLEKSSRRTISSRIPKNN